MLAAARILKSSPQKSVGPTSSRTRGAELGLESMVGQLPFTAGRGGFSAVSAVAAPGPQSHLLSEAPLRDSAPLTKEFFLISFLLYFPVLQLLYLSPQNVLFPSQIISFTLHMAHRHHHCLSLGQPLACPPRKAPGRVLRS